MEPGGSMLHSQGLSNNPMPSRINTIPLTDPYFFKVHSNIFLPSTPRPIQVHNSNNKSVASASCALVHILMWAIIWLVLGVMCGQHDESPAVLASQTGIADNEWISTQIPHGAGLTLIQFTSPKYLLGNRTSAIVKDQTMPYVALPRGYSGRVI